MCWTEEKRVNGAEDDQVQKEWKLAAGCMDNGLGIGGKWVEDR